ncbi:MAG: hypothetical protein RSD99_23825, partial [Janthinobacterium sp.]
LTEICPPSTAREGSRMLSGREEVEAGEVMGRYFNTPQAASRWQICQRREFICLNWQAVTVEAVQVFSDNYILPAHPEPPGATLILHPDGVALCIAEAWQ